MSAKQRHPKLKKLLDLLGKLPVEPDVYSLLAENIEIIEDIDKDLKDHNHCSDFQEHWINRDEAMPVVAQHIEGKLKARIVYENETDLFKTIFELLEIYFVSKEDS